MGAIGDAVMAYAQPLIDQTDGSPEQLQLALNCAMTCWNLAILPEDERQKGLAEMQARLGVSDAEFAECRRVLIEPMLRRHPAAAAPVVARANSIRQSYRQR